jgi:hypothetical protein
MDDVVPPLEPAIPAAPPKPLVLAVEPVAPVAAPPKPLVLVPEPVPVLPAPLDGPIAEPLPPECPEPLPISPHAVSEMHVKRPMEI